MKNTLDLMAKNRVIERNGTLLNLPRFLSYIITGEVVANREYPYTIQTTITISKSKL